jgi:Protein of unknown function (DUF4240)
MIRTLTWRLYGWRCASFLARKSYRLAAFSRYRREAYSWDLWGAAYVVNGGGSDDGFEYFCCWLVSRGREVYESALADSDGLAQLVVRPGANGPWEFEGINSVAQQVFEKKNAKVTCWTMPSRESDFCL